MPLRIELLILALILMGSLTITFASAQTSTTGTIEGRVTDRHEAVVRGVRVMVTSPNLILSQSATTDDEGRYRISNLPPGKYVVTVEASLGFARLELNADVSLSKTTSV